METTAAAARTTELKWRSGLERLFEDEPQGPVVLGVLFAIVTPEFAPAALVSIALGVWLARHGRPLASLVVVLAAAVSLAGVLSLTL